MQDVLTVEMPCCKDAQFFLPSVSVWWMGRSDAAHHSGACQDNSMDPARMASEVSRENWPSPPCKPFKATPRWW